METTIKYFIHKDGSIKYAVDKEELGDVEFNKFYSQVVVMEETIRLLDYSRDDYASEGYTLNISIYDWYGKYDLTFIKSLNISVHVYKFYLLQSGFNNIVEEKEEEVEKSQECFGDDFLLNESDDYLYIHLQGAIAESKRQRDKSNNAYVKRHLSIMITQLEDVFARYNFYVTDATEVIE